MSKAKAEELGDRFAEIGAHGVNAGPDSGPQAQPANRHRKGLCPEGIAATDLDLIDQRRRSVAVGLSSARVNRRRRNPSSTSTVVPSPSVT